MLSPESFAALTDRNVHGKIFGGWLMRRAFETAFACGWRTTGIQPKFLSLSDINFLAPVEIGALVHFEAQESWAVVAHVCSNPVTGPSSSVPFSRAD